MPRQFHPRCMCGARAGRDAQAAKWRRRGPSFFALLGQKDGHLTWLKQNNALAPLAMKETSDLQPWIAAQVIISGDMCATTKRQSPTPLNGGRRAVLQRGNSRASGIITLRTEMILRVLPNEDDRVNAGRRLRGSEDGIYTKKHAGMVEPGGHKMYNERLHKAL